MTSADICQLLRGCYQGQAMAKAFQRWKHRHHQSALYCSHMSWLCWERKNEKWFGSL